MGKILVTGGAGFIGSHVVERLVRGGDEVLVMDHAVPGALRKVAESKYGIEVFIGDVLDPVSVTEAAAHVDGIIHLAAVLGTQETILNPRPAAMTNVLGSLNIFEAANQYGLPVVYAGVGNHWMREHGAGAYTITKTAVEDFARMYRQFRGSTITVVRPVNAYGPRQSVAAPYGPSKVRKIIPSFVCRALAGDAIEIYGDGTQVSDMVHVRDVAHAFVNALSNHSKQSTFEIGPLESVTVNEIADMVRDEVSRVLDQEPVEVAHLPMRPGEVPNAVVSASPKGLPEIGIDPTKFVRLEDGIAEVVAWYKGTWWDEVQR
jgi:UDP-glucose 4-epimerase